MNHRRLIDVQATLQRAWSTLQKPRQHLRLSSEIAGYMVSGSIAATRGTSRQKGRVLMRRLVVTPILIPERTSTLLITAVRVCSSWDEITKLLTVGSTRSRKSILLGSIEGGFF